LTHYKVVLSQTRSFLNYQKSALTSVDVADDPALRLTTGSFTVEAWVKIKGSMSTSYPNSVYPIVTKRECNTGTSGGWQLHLTGTAPARTSLGTQITMDRYSAVMNTVPISDLKQKNGTMLLWSTMLRLLPLRFG
jgi:hypothetical protein